MKVWSSPLGYIKTKTMNHYVISQEHIDALRAMLERGIGRTGKPMCERRRRDLEKQIEKLEREIIQ